VRTTCACTGRFRSLRTEFEDVHVDTQTITRMQSVPSSGRCRRRAGTPASSQIRQVDNVSANSGIARARGRGNQSPAVMLVPASRYHFTEKAVHSGPSFFRVFALVPVMDTHI